TGVYRSGEPPAASAAVLVVALLAVERFALVRRFLAAVALGLDLAEVHVEIILGRGRHRVAVAADVLDPLQDGLVLQALERVQVADALRLQVDHHETVAGAVVDHLQIDGPDAELAPGAQAAEARGIDLDAGAAAERLDGLAQQLVQFAVRPLGRRGDGRLLPFRGGLGRGRLVEQAGELRLRRQVRPAADPGLGERPPGGGQRRPR